MVYRMSFAKVIRKNLRHYQFVKLPPKNLALESFWSTFYEEKELENNDESFEWFLKASTVGNVILKESNKNLDQHKILHVGSGTSELGPWLEKNGSEVFVTNVDFDQISCQQMSKRFPSQSWICCSIGSKEQPISWDNSFDIVVDKGTLDAVLFGGLDSTVKYAVGIERVLKNNGIIFQLTDEEPDTRLELLRCIFPLSDWNVSCQPLNDGDECKDHFCYKIWRKSNVF